MKNVLLVPVLLALPVAAAAQTRLDAATTLGIRRGSATLTVVATRAVGLRAGDVVVAFQPDSTCAGGGGPMQPALLLLTRPWRELAACGTLRLAVARGDSLFRLAVTPGTAAPRQRTVQAPTAGADVVAEAGGAILETDLLALILAESGQLAGEELARFAAAEWLDEALFAAAVASGDSLGDSAFVAAANWPAIAQARASILHDQLIVSRAVVTDAGVDSAYAANESPYIFHLLVGAPDSLAPAARAERRLAAKGYLQDLQAGADFAELAARVSDDGGSAAAGGRLGRIARGVTVEPFERAAFALPPGALSHVIETVFGFHILWRPPLAVVRDSFAATVRAEAIERRDLAYLDSLDRLMVIDPADSAAAWMREVASDPLAPERPARVLASSLGATLTAGWFAKWLQGFEPGLRGKLVQAPDSVLLQFLRTLARNDIVLAAADSHGVALPALDWGALVSRHRALTDTLRANLAPAGVPPQVAVAARLLAVLTSESGVAIPTTYAWALRGRGRWRWHPDRFARAVAQARTLGR